MASDITLTRQNINTYIPSIHSYDSFGRSICDLLLKMAADKVNKDNNINLDGIKASVSFPTDNEGKIACPVICIDTILGRVCFRLC